MANVKFTGSFQAAKAVWYVKRLPPGFVPLCAALTRRKTRDFTSMDYLSNLSSAIALPEESALETEDKIIGKIKNSLPSTY